MRYFIWILLHSLYFLIVGQKIKTIKSKDSDKNLFFDSELERQNRITKQILENYLQRKFFPKLTKIPKAPSVQEILPENYKQIFFNTTIDQNEKSTKINYISSPNLTSNNFTNSIKNDPNDSNQIDSDSQTIFTKGSFQNENLETVESEHMSNFIDHDIYGRQDNYIPPIPTMPLMTINDNKKIYLGIFFKTNWFKASIYCRFHGMHLLSITSQEENDAIQKILDDAGFGNEHFWTSGTDSAEESVFYWMSNGNPITFTNWNSGEPNNYINEKGEEENCLELWNRDQKGLKWNDSLCSFESHFICEL